MEWQFSGIVEVLGIVGPQDEVAVVELKQFVVVLVAQGQLPPPILPEHHHK